MGKHHVKNADLRAQLIKSKEQDELTKEVIDMFIIMSKRFADTLTYVYEEDKQDCIAGSIMDCFKYWRGYNPEKSDNAFAYITQIIKNGNTKQFRTLYKMPKSKKISISHNNIYTI